MAYQPTSVYSIADILWSMMLLQIAILYGICIIAIEGIPISGELGAPIVLIVATVMALLIFPWLQAGYENWQGQNPEVQD